MTINVATSQGDGTANEDIARAGRAWAFVLDGATAQSSSGCVHSVEWYARRLGTALACGLAQSTVTLAEILANAIRVVTAAHSGICDLSRPAAPSSTAAIVRLRDTYLDYLVLADSPFVVDVNGDVQAVTDDRIDHLPGYDRDTVNRVRNTDNGFWVAQHDPAAAYAAIQGTFPAEQVRRCALATDGATRLVDHFGQMGWAEWLDLCTANDGPARLIERTRAVEDTPHVELLPTTRRGKAHDDATAIAWT